MAITSDSFAQIDALTVEYSWESDETPPVSFRLYREGVLVYEVVSDDGTGSFEFHVGPDEYPFVEVLDNECDHPTYAFPGKVVLNWDALSGAANYRIDELVAAVWTERATIPDDDSGVYQFLSRWLEDSTSHSFRVVPLDSAGNEGTAISKSFLLSRHPDPPATVYSYDSGTGLLTISAA